MTPPKMARPDLPCKDCAHSSSGVPFPGAPSGERPCMFCIRNPNGIEWEQGQWYDQTPSFKTPMDNYISLDRLTQDRVFAALDAIGRGERQVKERGDGYNFFRECGGEDSEINELTPTCCAGGPIEGHAYDCFMVIGFSFG